MTSKQGDAPNRKLRLSTVIDATMPAYVQVPFDVPEHATRFTLRYEYPKSDTCIIDLGLGDPALTEFPSKSGLVGWSGGARREVFIAKTSSTPGYNTGLRPGTWQVILGLYRVPATPITVEFEITFEFGPQEATRTEKSLKSVPRGPSWYCGDLHCHTNHSDAKGSAERLHATAKRENLDFLAVTDHNTTTAHSTYFDHASGSDLVFVPAYEFTTEQGHANVFGARKVEDFRVSGDQDVAAMITRIRNHGHLFSVNHDKPNIPWRYGLPEMDCMEVWHAPWLAGNHVTLALYQARLAEGRRMTAIGGSDFHQPDDDDTGALATLARPCTFLWCRELTVDGILDALRAGRSFVTEAPDGPQLILNVGDVGHGGEIAGAEPTSLSYRATKAVGDTLEIWDATGCISRTPINDMDAHGTLSLPNVVGFLRGQIVASVSRAGIIEAAQAHVADGKGGRLDWENAWNQPVLRALTSPIYVV